MPVTTRLPAAPIPFHSLRYLSMTLTWVTTLLLIPCGCVGSARAGEPTASVHSIEPDLVVPPAINGSPSAGSRVRATTPGWETTSVYHTLYLPPQWTDAATLPVIVEFPGNGGYQRGDDISHGTPEGCAIGYGLSTGTDAIWVCLPFVATSNGHSQNATLWWGDVEETKRYCVRTVRDVCERLGGDPSRVMLAGFSRGAIACSYIGLHDDEIASLWCALFCHSHFDGVRQWPYASADRPSASQRWARQGRRPVWASHEQSVDGTEAFLGELPFKLDITLRVLPFANHTDQWLLRELPLRREARDWYRKNVMDIHRPTPAGR